MLHRKGSPARLRSPNGCTGSLRLVVMDWVGPARPMIRHSTPGPHCACALSTATGEYRASSWAGSLTLEPISSEIRDGCCSSGVGVTGAVTIGQQCRREHSSLRVESSPQAMFERLVTHRSHGSLSIAKYPRWLIACTPRIESPAFGTKSRE